MTRPLFALRLLERFDADGAREALLGDLIEEIGLGRSRFWVWQQILALCGLAAATPRADLAETAHLIALAPGLLSRGRPLDRTTRESAGHMGGRLFRHRNPEPVRRSDFLAHRRLGSARVGANESGAISGTAVVELDPG